MTLPLISTKAIVDTLSVPVLVLDSSLRAVAANPAFCELLEISGDDVEGQFVSALIKADNGPARLRVLLETVLAHDGNLNQVDVQCDLPAGARKMLSVSARQVFAREQAVMVLVELRDVTGERETEQRLLDLNEALMRHSAELERINTDLEAFTRWVSHDLRTPLRFTSTVAHRLLEEHGPALPARAREAIHSILETTQEMGKLIENLLAFAQVDRVPIRRRRTDLARLVREALTDLKDYHQGRAVEIVIDKLPPCHADRALMKQVYLNLLANALKFTRPCEQAEVRAGFMQDEGATVYFVRDNGVGFETNEADSIFLPFHRLHRVQPLQGTGVGLTLVKRIIERHGGRIWAEGKPSGGAAFYFQLGE
jgi:PAS domain S-box-containing protein